MDSDGQYGRARFPTALFIFWLVIWVAAVLTSLVMMGGGLLFSFAIGWSTETQARVEAARLWLWGGVFLNIAIGSAGWLLARRWWVSILVAAPAILLPLAFAVDLAVVSPYLVFLPAAGASIVGLALGFVFAVQSRST